MRRPIAAAVATALLAAMLTSCDSGTPAPSDTATDAVTETVAVEQPRNPIDELMDAALTRPDPQATLALAAGFVTDATSVAWTGTYMSTVSSSSLFADRYATYSGAWAAEPAAAWISFVGYQTGARWVSLAVVEDGGTTLRLHDGESWETRAVTPAELADQGRDGAPSLLATIESSTNADTPVSARWTRTADGSLAVELEIEVLNGFLGADASPLPEALVTVGGDGVVTAVVDPETGEVFSIRQVMDYSNLGADEVWEAEYTGWNSTDASLPAKEVGERASAPEALWVLDPFSHVMPEPPDARSLLERGAEIMETAESFTAASIGYYTSGDVDEGLDQTSRDTIATEHYEWQLDPLTIDFTGMRISRTGTSSWHEYVTRSAEAITLITYDENDGWRQSPLESLTDNWLTGPKALRNLVNALPPDWPVHTAWGTGSDGEISVEVSMDITTDILNAHLPPAEEGTIYLTGSGRLVWAFDAATGEPRYSHTELQLPEVQGVTVETRGYSGWNSTVVTVPEHILAAPPSPDE